MDDQYYTVKEVADRLRVTRQAIYNWINEGKLRAVKVGSHTRIPKSAIEAFIQAIEPGKAADDAADE